jgi:hypothetical protein
MTRTGIITLAVLLLAGALGGFFFGRATIKPVIEGKTTRVDTLYIRDTITRETPVFTRVYVRDSIYVTLRDTLHLTDTVWLPREVKVYEDERYRAEVSGYQPSLDRIDIFVKDRIVTQDKTQVVTVKRNARWGIGLQAGYGAILNDGRIQGTPYIGVGLSWNILTF